MVLIQELNNNLIILSKDIIYILNRQDGSVDKVTTKDLVSNAPPLNAPKEVQEQTNSDINCICVSSHEKCFAISNENKNILIFNEYYNCIKTYTANRVPSKMCFTPSNDLIVADKTGDVYLYKLSEDDSRPPVLLLGHLSVVLDVLITDCGKYVITADRDEKIRVTCFPNTYNIACYCLGHKEFVTGLKVFGEKLLSSSGDGTIKLWNFLDGKLVLSINTNDYIQQSNVLEKFLEDLDLDNVEISAIPVVEMQAVEKQGAIFVAVALYKYDKLQIYKICGTKVDYLQDVDITNSFAFYLSSTELLVLTENKFSKYVFNSQKLMLKDDRVCANFYYNHKSNLMLEKILPVTILYKKKFDNVKEYLERKKMRIESA